MKTLKRVFCSTKKIPFLVLLALTSFLFDCIDDGILPWPAPFHISLASSDQFDDTLSMADAGSPASDFVLNSDISGDRDSHAEPSLTNGDTPVDGDTAAGTDNNLDAGANSNDTDTDTEQTSAPSGTDSFQQTGTETEHNDSVLGAGTDDTDTPDSGQPAIGEDGLPLVQYMQVEDDYFDDAVFIGDSRTRSLELYAHLDNTTFLADTGLTIYTVLDRKLIPSTMTSKTTVTEYLTNHQFKKIYLMLGINELGTGTTEYFCRSYGGVLETLRELQPDAIIYLQAILHISESKDNEHTYINNATIIERNEALQSLADNEHIFWLDPNLAVCDEKGYLIEDYTFDGVHLQAKYVYLWTDYLKQHAIQQEPPSAQPPKLPPEFQAIP